MSPLVMGIVNVTPDSFAESDPLVADGAVNVDAAVQRGLSLVAAGADFVDVGGESTRPGAAPVDAAEEQRRILPVIAALAEAGVKVSVDTHHAETATTAVSVGASIINDVSCGRDPQMFDVVAETGVQYVLMHNRGESADMYARAEYADIAAEVAQELQSQVTAALAAGVAREQLILDPGIGFAKTPAQNWDLLRNLGPVRSLDLPVLLGVSRKRFLGELLDSQDDPRPVEQRDAATAAFSFWAAALGLWAVRVHDVRATCDAIAVAHALAVNDA